MDEQRIVSYLNGTLIEEEALEVEAWCAASPENKKTLEQFYYMMFVGDRLSVMNNIHVDGSLAALKSQLKKNSKNSKKVNAMARLKRYAIPLAAFLTGLLFTFGFQYWEQHTENGQYTVATELGQRAQVTLPDGTRAWLNSATKLSFTDHHSAKERRVELCGEAYFEVSPTKDRPFVVRAKNIETYVLGTKFDVRARSNENRVVTTLLSGSVRIDLPDGKNTGYYIKPGQTINVDTRTHAAELTESGNPNDVLLWIGGKLHFENATFLTITQCLERHFDVKFKFMNEQLKTEQFTCQFETDDDIKMILSVLALTHRFTYSYEGQVIKLKKN